MATMTAASATVLPAKRKRAVISYAEEDDQLDNILQAEADAPAEVVVVDSDSDLDSDLEYGSRKVCCSQSAHSGLI